MRKVAVIGSGQSALLAAHGLLRAAYEVELYSDRSAQDVLDHGRPTGTAVRFARSLAYERELGLARWHDEAPKMDGLKVTICSHPAKPDPHADGALRGLGAGHRPPAAERGVDARLRATGRGALHREGHPGPDRRDLPPQRSDHRRHRQGGRSVLRPRPAAEPQRRAPAPPRHGQLRRAVDALRRRAVRARRSSTSSRGSASATGRRISTRTRSRSGTSSSRRSRGRPTIASRARGRETTSSASARR